MHDIELTFCENVDNMKFLIFSYERANFNASWLFTNGQLIIKLLEIYDSLTKYLTLFWFHTLLNKYK